MKPSSSSSARAPAATRAASSKSVPGCGSRSMRSSSGWSTSSRRTGQGWNVIVPICAAQATTAISVGQISSAFLPDGNAISRRLHVVRSALRDALLVEGVADAALAGGQGHARIHALGPALERGRPVVERAHDPVAHRQVVVDDVELGDRGGASVGGKITRSGLDTRTSRPPASTVVASGAAIFAPGSRNAPRSRAERTAPRARRPPRR